MGKLFIEVLNKAIEEDEMVCRAIRNLYRGAYDEKEILKHDGQRIVLFAVPVSRFETDILNEIDSFIGGIRAYRAALQACGIFTVEAGVRSENGRKIYSWSNYREVSDDYTEYRDFEPIKLEGYTIVDKTKIERILKARGWM